MKLYQMSSRPGGTERISSFLEDNFVCMGWPGIGDLEHTGSEELRERFHTSNIPGGTGKGGHKDD
ncbi:hypothetical protein J2Z22_002235 [Paenibacillus forsythiae]|uniref:Uncharacterized protein n=1 Tax=Paenibacillus forsythiae TaxID=365616 RepID=A0ABU3H797_9BACL|nr:hypothetical protein [Paenibacillus forsythiae]MDT3426701.1 hypothetical protein [Paenibacillus forsythiae]